MSAPVATARAVTSTGFHAGERLTTEERPAPAVRSSAGPLLLNLLLAAFYFRFVWSHAGLLASGGTAALPPLVMQEALLVVLFLTRRRSIATSSRVDDWAIGIAGTFMPLFMRPTDPIGALAVAGVPLQVLGLSLAVIGAACLGRSIGVVAADRGIQTGGLYRLVRHPMYAAYLVSYLGYVATYPRLGNLVIGAATMAALHLRAVAEERFLARDPAYRRYLARVRWRFVPAVY